MASEVCAALGLDLPAPSELVAVAEERGGDASFLTGCLVWRALRPPDGAVCLLALRDDFAHHRLVAKKLGCDLKAAVDSGRAVVLEPFAQFVAPSGDFASIDMGVEDNLRRVFLEVKNVLDSFPGRKCLVVDDLGDLLCLGAPLPMVVHFLQYCRGLPGDVSLVFRTRVFDEDPDQRALANLLAHMADVRVTVAGLSTGASADVTGSVQVAVDVRKTLLPKSRMLHYKATDRHVKVFAPGTAGIHRY